MESKLLLVTYTFSHSEESARYDVSVESTLDQSDIAPPYVVALLSLKLHESIDIIGIYSELLSFNSNVIPAPSDASFDTNSHKF